MLPTIQPYPFIFNYFTAPKKQTGLSTQRQLFLVCTYTLSGEKGGWQPNQNAVEWDECHQEGCMGFRACSTSGGRIGTARDYGSESLLWLSPWYWSKCFLVFVVVVVVTFSFNIRMLFLQKKILKMYVNKIGLIVLEIGPLLLFGRHLLETSVLDTLGKEPG